MSSHKRVRPVPSVSMIGKRDDATSASQIKREGNNVRVRPCGQEVALSTKKQPGSYDPGKPSDVSEE